MKFFIGKIISKPEFDSTVKEIINSSEYKHLNGGISDFIEGIKEAISDFIFKLLNKTFSGRKDIPTISKNLSTVFMIIGILIIIAIIVGIIFKMNKTFERKGKLKEILGEEIDDRTTPNSLRNKASLYEKQEEFREAIRYDFIAVLLLMHENTIVYLDETKTNEEIYNYLKKNRFYMLEEFNNMASTFNCSWYGHKVCNRDMYEKWKDNLNFLWNEVIKYENKEK